uniref:DUF6531 domain-containing protein n=1 Tax=Corynebacterium cystitidis TaxID=35757 RepID=UPI00211EF23F
GEAGQQIANKAYKKITRGSEICFAAEPVDMATGNMVDFVEDIHISGTLPLVVDRNANTAHQLGRALGPRWISTMDTHIEVLTDEVLMVAPDGALLTFPPAPDDGSEVRGDGRGWLLSYGDGTYRVRNITAGLTYEFAVYDTTDELGSPTSPQREDASPALNCSNVGIGIPPNSVADRFDVGIEIGLSAQIHHTGHRIDYFWDNATGHMTSMVRSDDTRLDITWDEAANRVASIWVSNPLTHPADDPQRLMSYQYDTAGQLIRVINSHAGVLRYHYDHKGRPCGWTDRNGASYYYRFDDHGRVTSQVGTGGMFPNILYWGDDTGDDAPLGGQVCVLLETAGHFPDDPLAIGDDIVDDYLNRLYQLPLYQALVDGGLDAAGLTGRGRTGERDDSTWTVPDTWLHDEVLGDIRPTVYRSTLSGDVWRIITPEGHVTDYEYNSYHQVTAVTDNAGATTRTDYNDDGLPVATYFPDGTDTHIEPGAWGVPVRVVGRDGLATEYEVDAFGITTAVTDPSASRTSMDYELRASGAVLATMTNPDGLTSLIECDNAGRELAVTDPAGRRTSLDRDVRGLVVLSMDPAGNTTTIDYTPEGWPTRITHPDGTCITATYDGEGNQLTVTNECGATTTTKYTVFDKPVATTDATGAVTRLAYNTQMQPVALTNADGRTWSYEYDLDGMITRETDYNGIVTESSLSTDGLISQVTTPAGMTTITRNLLGLTETIVDGSGTTTYAYDDLGRVTTITNPHTTITYDRDEYGRITAENLTLASGESTTHAVSLSPTGVITAEHLTLPSTGTITTSYGRNDAGEVSSSTLTHTTNGSDIPVPVAELTYSRGARGERNKITTGALVRWFDYDVRGRITTDHTARLTTSTETTTGTGAGLEEIAGRDFTWRADSVLTGIVDQLRGTTSFDVDVLGRVTGVTRDVTRNTSPSRPNPAGNLQDIYPGGTDDTARATEQGSAHTESYGFSAAGVLSSISTPTISTTSRVAAPAATSTTTTTAAAVTDSQVEFHGTMPTRVGRTTYTYDKAGRVTQTVTKRISKKPLVKHFYYTTGGQPVGFDTSDEPGVGYRYIYDGLDRRVAKEQIDTATGRVLARTVFVHRGNELVAQQATVGPERGAGFVWTHDPASSEIIGQITLTGTDTHDGTTTNGGDTHSGDVRDWDQDRIDAEFFVLVADLAGAPHEIIDPSTGDVVGSSSQTLYGKRTWHGEQSSPLLFAGQYYDEESGWAYNRFRYYHPDAGVYNAQDPLGASPRIASAQGYVDHAANLVDPLGLKVCARTTRNINDQLLKNKLLGRDGERIGERVIERDLTNPNIRTSSQVTVHPHGISGNSRIDSVIREGDTFHAVEFKTGGAGLSENQQAVSNALNSGNSVEFRGGPAKTRDLGFERGQEVYGDFQVFRTDTWSGLNSLKDYVRSFN